MWVPKQPTPFDFCGRPPCPICFDWQEPNGELLDGAQKYHRDMLGADKAPTPEQKQTLDTAAQLIHERNRVPVVERDAEAFDEADQEQRMQRWLSAKAAQAKREKPAKKRTKVLDHMDLSKIKPTPKPKADPTKNWRQIDADRYRGLQYSPAEFERIMRDQYMRTRDQYMRTIPSMAPPILPSVKDQQNDILREKQEQQRRAMLRGDLVR